MSLTFGRAVDHLVLLLGVLEDTLGAEHVAVLHTVELHFLLRVRLAVLNLACLHLARRQCRVCSGGHREPSEDLVVDWQVVRVDVVRALVIRALDRTVLGEFANTFTAERVSTRERSGLLVVVIVRLEADATFED